jgi:hypothetical protein
MSNFGGTVSTLYVFGNAVTGQVKSDQIHMSGNATNQACGGRMEK